MAKLHSKIENAVNEARILILGGQVVAGVQFRIFFEEGFQRVARSTQLVLFGGMTMLLLGLAFVMAPASYHTIVEEHRDTANFHRFTTAVTALGLLPFALSLGSTLFITFEKFSGTVPALIAAAAGTLLCLVVWYGLPLLRRARPRGRVDLRSALYPLGKDLEERVEHADAEQKVSEEVKEVLTEARMVLPGAQALLGFQLINVWLKAFDTIPSEAKLMHLISLCFVALSTVLLMMPAAYHRIAEAGDDSQAFVNFAGRVLMGAMALLALGICGDFYVITLKLELGRTLGLALSTALLAIFCGLWFGYTLWKRQQIRADLREELP